jgi:hypothetical protein
MAQNLLAAATQAAAHLSQVLYSEREGSDLTELGVPPAQDEPVDPPLV